MEVISTWLKDTIWGIIILGCFGSAICAFLIFIGKKIFKHILLKYIKYMKKKKYIKGYINGYILATISNKPDRLAISFTRRLFIFIIENTILVISIFFLIYFINNFENTFPKIFAFLLSLIISLFSIIKISLVPYFKDFIQIDDIYDFIMKQINEKSYSVSLNDDSSEFKLTLIPKLP